MPPFTFGPIYCETMSATSAGFPVEPMNTISNGVIVMFGLAALYLVVKRAPRAGDLYALCALLVITGIGSGIWHGLRDGQALFFEVQSGLFFLFALVFFWARRLWSYLGAALFLVLFAAGFVTSRQYWNSEIFGFEVQRWVALAPLVILAGIVLITQTYMHSKRAALYSSVALSSALVALTFRTMDLSACAYIPFGTHWLWHSFLSCGGFLGIVALIELPALRSAKRASQPATEPAE
jgi:hypothetical protein